MTPSHEARIEAACEAFFGSDHWKKFGPSAKARGRRDIGKALTAYLAGDVVVPREVTYEMRAAAVNVTLPEIGEPPLYEKIYRAMVSAATEMEQK